MLYRGSFSLQNAAFQMEAQRLMMKKNQEKPGKKQEKPGDKQQSPISSGLSIERQWANELVCRCLVNGEVCLQLNLMLQLIRVSIDGYDHALGSFGTSLFPRDFDRPFLPCWAQFWGFCGPKKTSAGMID